MKDIQNQLTKTVSILILLIVIIQSCGETKRKTKEEAYTVIEKQDVTLTYLVNDNQISYHRTDGNILFGDNPKMKVYCSVTNTTEHGGVFKLYATMASQGNTLQFNDEKYLSAGETKEFTQEVEINPYSFETNVEIDSWGIIAPTISIDKEVTKYRTVEYD
jgi:uncharacterized protein (UPF0248 family)